MNWLDIVVLVLIIVSIVGGLKAGLIKVLFTIAGLIIGVVLAGNYAAPLAERLGFSSGTAEIVVFIVIMLVVMIVAALLAFIIKKIASAVLLGWVNHLGGAVLGLLLGIIFCGALLAMWVKYMGIGDTIESSWMANFLIDKFPLVLGLLPEQFNSIKHYFN